MTPSSEIRPAGMLLNGSPDPGGPPILMVPGSKGDPELYAELLAPVAERLRRPLTVVDFAGRFGNGYQQLRIHGRPLEAAKVLDDALQRLGTPSDTPVDLIGFSGGAQFAHRYALLFPGRVRRLVLGAPGWYTYLNTLLPFPHGTKASSASGGVRGDIEGFLRLDVLLTVGERDVHRGGNLRTGSELDNCQGEHRLARALRWTQHVGECARSRGIGTRVVFELLPATGHSFRQAITTGGLADRLERFLRSTSPVETRAQSLIPVEPGQ